MTRVLIKGNEAIGEAAVRAGCRYFFGYPITPQNEVPEYLSKRLPEVGGVFVQAESELAAINMVYGAAATGVRVMTSSSSPGISLKQEGISYIATAELPCLIVNIMRGGPGLGGIQPAQSDYFQATRGGGHGDYRTIVLAPGSIQEMVEMVDEGFNLAEKYRIPVLLLGDGILGQMMEAVELKEAKEPDSSVKQWSINPNKKDKNAIFTLYLDAAELEQVNRRLEEKYNLIRLNEKRAELYHTEDADLLVAAYGITARIAKAAVDMARAEGLKVGLFRPQTLWPFPDEQLDTAAQQAKRILTVEMSLGQMVEDVKLAVQCRIPVDFFGRVGGIVPCEREIFEEIKKNYRKLQEVK